MARYDRGYDRPLRPTSADWASPGGPARGPGYDRGFSGSRPGVGGYRPGYQGGSSGIPVGGSARGDRGRPEGGQGRSRGAYGGDYWWLGERAFAQERSRQPYDERYRRFDESHHPRYSPVGGTYHAMGGEYQYRRPPGPLREEQWFSDWTRWF